MTTSSSGSPDKTPPKIEAKWAFGSSAMAKTPEEREIALNQARRVGWGVAAAATALGFVALVLGRRPH